MPLANPCWGPDRAGYTLRVENDRVASYDQSGDGSECLDCSAGLIEPGAINAHTHIYSGLAPLGMPAPAEAPANFVEILEKVWWRLDRALDHASLRASARLYVAEALLAGTTTLIDHHESPEFIEGSLDVLADACDELGIRAILCFGATERNGGRYEASRGLAECRRFIETNRRPLVRGLVALHASFTVSDDTLQEAASLCRELGAPMHIHLAEDGADVEDAIQRGYPGPLERLLEFEALPPGSVLAHGVHLSEEQVKLATERGLWLVQNPRSNHGNGVGYPRSLRASSKVALGTDGYPAQMNEEQRVLSALAAENRDDSDAVSARAEAGHALAGELFGLALSPLAEGTAADAVVRSETEDGSLAQHVMVAGTQVVESGRLLTGDLDSIRADAEQNATKLWDRMAALA